MITLICLLSLLLLLATVGSERTSFGHQHSRLQDHQEDELFAPLKVMCEINGFSVPAIIDTGAQISIMSSSCARRCHLYQQINRQFSGKALGVGSGEIIGRIDSMGVRMGPLTFNSRISVLRDSHVDFLIGLDFLKRFRGEVNLKENVLKLVVKDKHIRIPFFSESKYGHSITPYDDDEKNHSHVCVAHHAEGSETDRPFPMSMSYGNNDMDLEKEIDEDIKNLDINNNNMNSKRVREVYCMEHARHPKEDSLSKNRHVPSHSSNNHSKNQHQHPAETLQDRERNNNNNNNSSNDDEDNNDDGCNDSDVVSMEGI